jgi:hypothetical protein
LRKYSLNNNNKGSAIILALMVTVGLMGYTLYFINSSKLQAKILTQSKNDVEVIGIAAQVKSMLSTPANCNATFIGKPVSSSLNTVSACATGEDCFTTINATLKFKKNTLNGSWSTSDTLSSSPNVKIIDMPYVVTNPQVDTTFPVSPAIVTINLKFAKKNYGNVAIVEEPIEVLVVLNAAHDTIIGCPKDPASVDAIGDKSCHLPWGPWTTKIPHGSMVAAYGATHAPSCVTVKELRVCNNTSLSGAKTIQTCINDGNWSPLLSSGWVCSVSCGGGFLTQDRTCTYPPPDAGGTGCLGTSLVVSNNVCNPQACSGPPVNGGWTNYSAWSACISPGIINCGPGKQKKTRTCTNPIPSNGGAGCSGTEFVEKNCTNICTP